MRQLEAGIEMMAWASKLRGMATSGPADVIEHYQAVEDQLERKNRTDKRNRKRQLANEVRGKAEAYLLEIKPGLDLIRHFERIGADTADEAVATLRKLLPSAEANIERAIAEAHEPARAVTTAREIPGERGVSNGLSLADVIGRQAIDAHLQSGRAVGGMGADQTASFGR